MECSDCDLAAHHAYRRYLRCSGGRQYARRMCGIAGKITSRENEVERHLIDKMCDVLEHRGPDSRGVFLDRNVGLGVQRLAVIDLRTGDQPVFNEDGSIVVVLNGE